MNFDIKYKTTVSLDDTLQSTPYKSGQNNSTVTERPKVF